MIFLSSGLDLTFFRIHDRNNKLHDTIKFTHEISDTELTFLDITLIHRLKHRGYRQNQIIQHVNEIKFNQRHESLTKIKQKEPKLVFTTNYCDDIHRIECLFKKKALEID